MGHVTRVLCVFVWYVYMSDYSTVSGQGRMLNPPGRSSMWRVGYETPMNDNDNLLSCGGVQQRWVINNGKCGVCGDPWDSKPRDNEAGGQYAKEIITSVFTSGSLVEVTIDAAIVNGGYFEFRLCANNDFKKVVTQECLDSGLLVVNGTNATRYNSIKGGLNHILLQIPDHVTCDQCVLQWKYRTADHYGCDVNTTTTEETCGFGLGKIQTEYYACSDIAIYSFKDKQKIQDTKNKHNIKSFNIANEKNNEHNSKSPTRLKRTIHNFHAPLMPQFVSYKPDFHARNEQYNTVIDTGYGWNTKSMAHPLEFPRSRSRRQLENYRRRAFRNSHTSRPRLATRNSRVQVGRGQMYPGIEAPETSLIEAPLVTRQLIRTSSGRSVPTHIIRGEETIISTQPVFHRMGPTRDTFISPLNPQVSVKTTNTISKHYMPTKQCNACPFDQCMDPNIQYDAIFPGLFENPLTFLECRRYEKLYTVGSYKTVSEGLPECGIHPRFRRQLSPRMFDQDDDGGCCTTRADVILPLTVKSDNETYTVVQLNNDKNQFMVQGICGNHRLNSTRSCSRCEAENNFQWVLVYDPRSTSRPPVSFVPVKFNHYCRCRNPGRRTG